MMWRAVLLLLAGPVWADAVVTTRPIAAATVVTPEDVTLVGMDIPGAFDDLRDVIGLTTAGDLVAGRPVRAGEVFAPMQIDRNAIVALVVQTGGMEIRTEGRALSAAKVGETIDIMNLSSRARIRGTVQADGSVRVTTTR